MGVKKIIVGLLCLLMSTFAVAQCPVAPNVFQPNANAVQYSQNNHLMLILFEVTDDSCDPELTKLLFDYTGTSLGDVANLKIYYSGPSAVFDPNTNDLFAEVSPVTGSMSVTGNMPLEPGFNHFWVAVDVPLSADAGNVIDARLNIVEVSTNTVTQSFTDGIDFIGAPPEELTVTARPIVEFNVVGVAGGGGIIAPNFISIQAAYDAIPATLLSDYVINVRSSYNSLTDETFPLVFNQKLVGANDIYIWPEAGGNILVQGQPPTNYGPMVVFNGADNVVIDGRNQGVAGASQMIWRNTRNDNRVGSVFTFRNGATNNQLKYLGVQANTNNNVSGLVDFLTSGGGTGNSNNRLEYNKFEDNPAITGFLPGVAIYSAGDAGLPNVSNVISNNEFVSIWDGPRGANSFALQLFSGTSNWTVEGNHFYQEAGTPYVNNDVGCGFITVLDGDNYVIRNNYFGGTEKFGGGGPMMINGGTSPFDFVYFSGGTLGSKNVIQGNHFGNFSYASTASVGGYPTVSLLYNEGPSNFDVARNEFGSMNGTDSIVVTNTNTGSASNTYGFMAVVNNQTQDNAVIVTNNQFGGIKIKGTNPNMASSMVFNQNEGALTVSENTIGSTENHSIRMDASSQISAIRDLSTSLAQINSNTIQNLTHNGASGSMYAIYKSFGDLSMEANSISDIESRASSSVEVVYFRDGEFNIIDNQIVGVNVFNNSTGTVSAIHVNTGSDGSIEANTIQSILSNKDGDVWGIQKSGTGGVIDINDNLIESIVVDNVSSTLAELKGVHLSSGVLNANGNRISELVSNAQGTANIIEGISVTSSSINHSITNNEIYDLVIDAGANTSAKVTGIDLSSGSGRAEGNYIHSFQNGKSNATSYVRGVEVMSGSWDIYNNVIWFRNTNGIDDYQLRAVRIQTTGTVNFHHNTVKLEILPTMQYYFATCLYVNSNGALDVRNNVFQNLADGRNATFEAKTICALTAHSTPTFSNNYHECPFNPTDYIRWGGTGNIYDVATWNGQAGRSGGFEGNEIINDLGYPSGNQLESQGVATTVANDKDGVPRSGTTPWVGAYEGAMTPVLNLSLYYVDQDATGANDGSSWGDAFIQLSDALMAADLGDTIVVAEGRYTPTQTYDFNGNSLMDLREETFLIPAGVKIWGGFEGVENVRLATALSSRNLNAQRTILSGDLNGDDVIAVAFPGRSFANNGENSLHVVTIVDASPRVEIDGVTISGGNTDISLGFAGPYGAGVLLYAATTNSDVVIKNSIIEDNIAELGTAIYARGDLGGSPTNIANGYFVNSLMRWNIAAGSQGAVLLNFSANNNLVFQNCNVIQNEVQDLVAFGQSRGVVSSVHGNFRARNSIFWNNSALDQWISIIVDSPGGSATIENCIMQEDSLGQLNGGRGFLVTSSNSIFGQDPLFLNPGLSDYTPDYCSPAINNGAEFSDDWDYDGDGDSGEALFASGVISTDYDNGNRVEAAIVDIGLIEKSISDTIVLQPVPSNTVCTRATTYELQFCAYGAFNAGNHFIVQLSNSTGSFASPMNLDTITTSNPILPLQSIPVTLRDTIPAGNGYRVRVVSTNVALESNNNGGNLIFHPTETATWQGGTAGAETDWFNCDNWDTGRVPGENSAVIIPMTVNQPQIAEGIARCQTISIDVDNGANVTLDSSNNGELQIFGP